MTPEESPSGPKEAEERRAVCTSAFLDASAVRQLLARAQRSAAMPLSLHRVSDDGEDLLGSWGHCNLCAYVARTLNGPDACQASRLEASFQALRDKRPRAVICHMGLACLSIPALPDVEPGLVLTFGPYCPAESFQTMEADALAGLAALGVALPGGMPVTLSDIHIVPADAAPAIAEWTSEALAACWRAHHPPPSGSTDELPQADSPKRARSKPRRPAADPFQGAGIAAALLSGNRPQARALVRTVLCEAGGKARSQTKRLRAAAIAAATLEAAEKAGADTSACWDSFPAFSVELRAADSDRPLISAVMRVIGDITTRRRQEERLDAVLGGLNRLLTNRMGERTTLEEAARLLGERPSTLTRRLERTLGMSFTQYANRLRVDRAKELLRRTQLTIVEVSRRVGMNDPGNFAKLFVRWEGMSPSSYRARYGRKT